MRVRQRGSNRGLGRLIDRIHKNFADMFAGMIPFNICSQRDEDSSRSGNIRDGNGDLKMWNKSVVNEDELCGVKYRHRSRIRDI